MNTLLGFADDDEPVHINIDQLAHHLYVLGKSGMGKTGCLCTVCVQLMQENGLIVIDPVGSLIERVKERIPDERVDDVIVIQPSDLAHPFALNPLAPQPPREKIGQYASLVMSVFELVMDERDWTSRTRQMLRNILIMLLSRTKGPNGEQFPPCLDEISPVLSLFIEDSGARFGRGKKTTYRGGLYKDLLAAGHFPVARFWIDYVDKIMTPRPLAEANAMIGGVVDQFMSNPMVRNMVGQTETKIDFLEAMNAGKIILADLSEIGDENADFLGSLLMAQLAASTAKRKRGSRPFFIVADEISRYGGQAFKQISRKGRNVGVHLIAAQQDQTDMRPWQKGLMGNASNRICFQLMPPDAAEQSREFDATPPPGDPEHRQRLAFHIGLNAAVSFDDRDLYTRGQESINDLAALANGYSVPGDRQFATLCWLKGLRHALGRIYTPGELGEVDEAIRTVDAHWISHSDFTRIDELYDYHFRNPPKDNSARSDGYIQERVVYPPTPGTWHKSWSSSESTNGLQASVGSSSSHSEGSETGPIFDKVEGRRRSYADVWAEIANQLTHLPRRCARAKLVGSDDGQPPLEVTFRTVDLSQPNPRWELNWDRIEATTWRLFCRELDLVEDEVRTRDAIMRRAVEQWHLDEAHRAEGYESDSEARVSDEATRSNGTKPEISTNGSNPELKSGEPKSTRRRGRNGRHGKRPATE